MAANECHNEPMYQLTSKNKAKTSGEVGEDSAGKQRCGWWAPQNSSKAMSLVARSGMRERERERATFALRPSRVQRRRPNDVESYPWPLSALGRRQTTSCLIHAYATRLYRLNLLYVTVFLAYSSVIACSLHHPNSLWLFWLALLPRSLHCSSARCGNPLQSLQRLPDPLWPVWIMYR